ncbi:MAG TPA: type II secretion system protein [Tepidisphaeraceae bacterium]|jgi:prepilin-type N-terminal cleavage/methylation domain-containing protein
MRIERTIFINTRGSEARRMRCAFTLIEVLATMMLLGIVLPVTLRAISLGIAAASHARHTSEASNLAQEKLSELVVGGISTASTSGDFGTDHPDYRWTLQTQTRDYALTEAQLTVTWMERGQERVMTVSTLTSDTLGSSTGGTP